MKTILILALGSLFIFIPNQPHSVREGGAVPDTGLTGKSSIKLDMLLPLPVPTLKAVEPIVAVAVQATPSPPQGGAVAGCGDNEYANYIYMHESGCVTDRVNSIGCLGIGQSCPGSKLTAVCPNLDYACENSWFDNYAQTRYNGWYNAYLFWQQNHWW